MNKYINNLFKLPLISVLIINLVGCGGVNEEQLQNLNDLKAEVDALQTRINIIMDEKSDIKKQIEALEEKLRDWQEIANGISRNCQ